MNEHIINLIQLERKYILIYVCDCFIFSTEIILNSTKMCSTIIDICHAVNKQTAPRSKTHFLAFKFSC